MNTATKNPAFKKSGIFHGYDLLFFGGFFNGRKERIFYVSLLFLRSGFDEFDVNFVADELRSEADILALFANGDGLLIFGYEDFGFFAVDFDFVDFGRA